MWLLFFTHLFPCILPSFKLTFLLFCSRSCLPLLPLSLKLYSLLQTCTIHQAISFYSYFFLPFFSFPALFPLLSLLPFAFPSFSYFFSSVDSHNYSSLLILCFPISLASYHFLTSFSSFMSLVSVTVSSAFCFPLFYLFIFFLRPLLLLLFTCSFIWLYVSSFTFLFSVFYFSILLFLMLSIFVFSGHILLQTSIIFPLLFFRICLQFSTFPSFVFATSALCFPILFSLHIFLQTLIIFLLLIAVAYPFRSFSVFFFCFLSHDLWRQSFLAFILFLLMH